MPCLARIGPVFFVVLSALLFFSSCQRKLGWGVLLWANEKSNIPSGTVLPVFIKSNIEKVWVAGVPKEYQKTGSPDEKIEIPLAQLELSGSQRKAKKRAGEFGEYALIYAETIQDGLPVREQPDNSAPRVYRLRIGEIIKILSLAQGNPAISATGTPLPGDWFKVLTQDGTRGYCFSYRLRLFEHTTGPLVSDAYTGSTDADSELEAIQSKIWSAEVYGTMLNDRKFDIDALGRHWAFSTGEDTGIANVYTGNIDKSFHYTAIKKTAENSWRFEGTSLSMSLISENVLEVDFTDDNGARQVAHFVSLPTTVDDLIAQEKNRRESELRKIYRAGPAFSSTSYGVITFTEDNNFLWEDFGMLIPDYLPSSVLGQGSMELRYSLDNELTTNYDYTGVLTLRFRAMSGPDRNVNFLYTLGADGDAGALRLEYIKAAYIKDNTVARLDQAPLVIYFYKQEG